MVLSKTIQQGVKDERRYTMNDQEYLSNLLRYLVSRLASRNNAFES